MPHPWTAINSVQSTSIAWMATTTTKGGANQFYLPSYGWGKKDWTNMAHHKTCTPSAFLFGYLASASINQHRVVNKYLKRQGRIPRDFQTSCGWHRSWSCTQKAVACSSVFHSYLLVCVYLSFSLLPPVREAGDVTIIAHEKKRKERLESLASWTFRIGDW